MLRNIMVVLLAMVCIGTAHADEVADVWKVHERVAEMVFVKFVPDALVINIMNRALEGTYIETHHMNAMAREEVFYSQLKEVYPKYNDYNDAWYFAQNPEQADERVNKKVLFPLKGIRDMIMDKALDYLSDPDRLWDFYLMKKTIIIEDLKNRDLNEVFGWLSKATSALVMSSDPKFIVLHGKMLVLENEMDVASDVVERLHAAYLKAADDLVFGLDDEDEFKGEVMDRSLSTYWPSGQREPIRIVIPIERRELFNAYSTAEEEFDAVVKVTNELSRKKQSLYSEIVKITPDYHASFWAKRRYEQNGQKLVNKWIEIAMDIRKTFQP